MILFLEGPDSTGIANISLKDSNWYIQLDYIYNYFNFYDANADEEELINIWAFNDEIEKEEIICNAAKLPNDMDIDDKGFFNYIDKTSRLLLIFFQKLNNFTITY